MTENKITNNQPENPEDINQNNIDKGNISQSNQEILAANGETAEASEIAEKKHPKIGIAFGGGQTPLTARQ